VLLAEKCVATCTQLAQQYGAEIHTNERLQNYQQLENGMVQVSTDRGTYQCKKLILTVGAWSNKFIHVDMQVKGEPFMVGKPERQVVGWFKPKTPELYEYKNFPIFCMTGEDLHNKVSKKKSMYGFPVMNESHHEYKGFKIGVIDHVAIDPDNRTLQTTQRDEGVLRMYIQKYFPEADGEVVALKECMFVSVVAMVLTL
jgi:glycine/D-amino acid oxidase-like deaminating enzyme